MSEPVPNLRDLGGLPTEDGATTAHGVLLRSAVPSADDAGPDGVRWPPSLVLDLRSRAESGPSHPLAAAGATVRQISLLEALRPDGAQSADPQVVARMATGGLQALYLGMLEVARAELAQVAREVAAHDGPTLLHCAAGKDRTGVAVAMILRTAGVSRDAVVKDYLATGASMEAVLRRLQISAPIDSVHRPPASYLAIPQDAIDAVLDVWDSHPGGTAGWLYDAGAEAQVVDGLRDRLVG